MPRVLLILPSSTYRAPEFLAAAQKMAIEVVTASDASQALAGVMGDHFVALDLSDPGKAADAIVRASARTPFDAVIAVDDQGLLAATLASERLGLLSNPLAAVAATRDKAAMRQLLAGRGTSQPDYAIVDVSRDDFAERAGEAAQAIGFPAVLKPSALSGSRGVIRVEDEEGARSAARRIAALCSDATGAIQIVIEGFVAGVEVALEGLLTGGVLQVLALFDKPAPLDGPFFEETIYVTPSRHDQDRQRAVADEVQRACAALGLREGPIHAEARITATGRVVIIETAARTIGGKCAKALQFSTGASLEEIVIEHALSAVAPVAPPLRAGASGVMMLPIPQSGRLLSVSGRREALATPGVTALEISIPIGHYLEALPEGDRYLGFLFARAEAAPEVENALRQGFEQLQVSIDATAPKPGLVRA